MVATQATRQPPSVSVLRKMHRERCLQLQVKKEFLRDDNSCAPTSPSVDAIRVLQWNILADGLADDGFLVQNVCGAESVDVANEMAAARGDPTKLQQLHDRCVQDEMQQSNLRVLVDWKRRWLKMQEIILRNDPSIITLQELDHMGSVQEDLRGLGYVCTYLNQTPPAYRSMEHEHRDTPQYFKDLYESGIAFAPKSPSNAKKYGQTPNADNDGCAIFWKERDLKATRIDFVGLDGTRNDGCVRVELERTSDARRLFVICAHLHSGGKPEDERQRLSEICEYTLTPVGAKTGPSLLEWFEQSQREHPTLFCLDANSEPTFCLDANSEPTRRDQQTVWRAMHEAGLQSVWDDRFDRDGQPRDSGKLVVTTNKMRGPLSNQPKKIGEHVFGVVDHIYFSGGMEFKAHIASPLEYENSEAMRHLLPSLEMPSDHVPVIVDFILPRKARGKLALTGFPRLEARLHDCAAMGALLSQWHHVEGYKRLCDDQCELDQPDLVERQPFDVAELEDALQPPLLNNPEAAKVACLASTPSGQFAVAVTWRDKKLHHVFDHRREVPVPMLKDEEVLFMLLRPQSDDIVAASKGMAVALWSQNHPANEPVWNWSVGEEVACIACAGGEEQKWHLAVATKSKEEVEQYKLFSWDLDATTPPNMSRKSIAKHHREVNALAIKSGTLASGGKSKIVALHDTKEAEDTTLSDTSKMRHDGSVLVLRFAPHGDVLASGAKDCKVKLWSIAKMVLMRVLEHDSSVTALAFSPDGALFASGSEDRKIKLWSEDTLMRVLDVAVHDKRVAHLAFGASSRFLFSAGEDGKILKTQVLRDGDAKIDLLPRLEPELSRSPSVVNARLSGWQVRSIAFTDVAKLVAVSTLDTSVHVAWQDVRQQLNYVSEVCTLQSTKDGAHLAIYGKKSTRHEEAHVHYFKLTGQEEDWTPRHSFARKSASCLALSADCARLAVGSYTEDTEVVTLCEAHDRRSIPCRDVRTMAFAPQSYELAVAHGVKVSLFESESQRAKGSILHRASVLAVAFGANGQLVASASKDRRLKISRVDSDSLELVHEILHDAVVCTLAFGRDLLASAGFGGHVHLHDVRSGELVRTLEFSGVVRAAAFSPDAHILAIGGDHPKLQSCELRPSDDVLKLWIRSPIAPPIQLTRLLHAEFVRWLLWLSGPSGRPLVSHAVLQGDLSMLMLSELPGVSVLRRDVNGKHALDYALELRHSTMIAALLPHVMRTVPPNARSHLVDFLVELAGVYPELVSLSLELDLYRPYDGAPSFKRVARSMLKYGTIALQGDDSDKPREEFWKSDGVGAEVDVRCALVGLPHLLEGRHGLFRAFTRTEHSRILTSDVMHAVITFKWEMYGKSIWHLQVSGFALFFLCYELALILVVHAKMRVPGLVLITISFAISLHYLCEEVLEFKQARFSVYRHFVASTQNIMDAAQVVVQSFVFVGLLMDLPYANSLGAVGSLLMLPKAGAVTRGSEQLSFTVFVLRSILYDMASFTVVVVYVLLVSTVAFVLLLEENDAQDYGGIGIAAFTTFRLLLGDFEPETYVDGQNVTLATVVFAITMFFVNIVLLNMLIALMTDTWTRQQSERTFLGLRGRAQLLNEFEARMSTETLTRADWFPKWLHVIKEAPTPERADRTAAALQLQVIVQGRTNMIDACSSTTAAQLEHMVAARVKIDSFGLYYGGRPLHGSTSLGNYGITSGATIELKERGRGGGCVQSKSSVVVVEEPVPGVEAEKPSHSSHATIEAPESAEPELPTPHAPASPEQVKLTIEEPASPAQLEHAPNSERHDEAPVSAVEAEMPSHTTHATIEKVEATEPESQSQPLQCAGFRERHDERAKILGVSTDLLASLCAPEVRSIPNETALRVLQWNVLADGLSDDGFEVRDVLGMGAHTAARAKSNHAAVVDWTRRWARMLEFIDVARPHVIAFEELDHMAEAQRELASLGYECSVHGKTYRPVHDWAEESNDHERYMRHLEAVGVAFAPKTRSNCRKLGLKSRADADDDGVALFWRVDALELLALDFLAFDDPERDQGAVRATLRRRSDGLAFAVITTHLSSGADNEGVRLAELTRKSRGGGPSLREWFEMSEKPTLLCLDANSAPGGQVWKELRNSMSSVWDDFFDPEGRALKEETPVTTNKRRGPLSSQPKKVGEHAYGAVGSIFFSAEVSLLQHAWGPLRYASAEEAAKELLPSLEVPSDLTPVLVDLAVSSHVDKAQEAATTGRASTSAAAGTRERAESTTEDTPAPKFANEEELEAWLHRSDFDTEEWDDAAIGRLFQEQRECESELYSTSLGPLRVMRVVNVRILSDDKRCTLIQTHSETDGDQKEVMRTLSGKLKSGDTEEAAAQKCVQKAFPEISRITLDLSTRTEYVGAKSTSSYFPHLACRFIVVAFETSIDERILPQGSGFRREEEKEGLTTTRHWAWQWRLALPKALNGKLTPSNFETLWAEKRASHLQGTREWAFDEVFSWLARDVDTENTTVQKLFWLKGGGGVGKSVMSAELLARLFDKGRVAAWHFCRHDNKEQSEPTNLLRSLSAMLCHTLKGYETELLKEPAGVDAALTSVDPQIVFDTLFAKPLQRLQSSDPRVVLIDALDEIPKEGQKPLLDVIANQLSSLPHWLRLFVTSREETQIEKALSKFNPRELRADEANNRADVDIYLRTIARKHVSGEVSMAEVAIAVEREFKVKLPEEQLKKLQENIQASREMYDDAVRSLEADPALEKLKELKEKLEPKPKQSESDFNKLYCFAERAQRILEDAVASEWEFDHKVRSPDGTLFLKHPKRGKAEPWVDEADSPGVKSRERAQEKLQNDYNNDATQLKDVARQTLIFGTCDKMIGGVDALRNCGFEIVSLKNKYQNPTAMGYRDLNLCVAVPVDDKTRFVCEVQINHKRMLEAKEKAHKPYEIIRSELPKLCKASGVDTDQAGKIETFMVRMLHSSALEVAVAALSAKADGLFLYAHMLKQHLETEKKAGNEIKFDSLNSLPAGLSEVYQVNFERVFPDGARDPGWRAAKPLVELIATAMEPISVTMARDVLGLTADEQERVLELTALLFPVRDGLIHVFHKTVIDWLTGDINEGSSLKARSNIFAIVRSEGHARFAAGFVRWLAEGGATHDGTKEGGAFNASRYWLQHGIVHLCRAQWSAKAAEVFSTELRLLQRRLDEGLLTSISKDYLELRHYCRGASLDMATQMKAFIGKHRDVLERERGCAVTQLASQQPDKSVVFRSLPQTSRYLKWLNKPQEFDPCVATLAHSSGVRAVAVSHRLIIGGAGNAVYVYDAATEELMETLDGTSQVHSVAISEAKGSGVIAAGYSDGTIKVWDLVHCEARKMRCHEHPIRKCSMDNHYCDLCKSLDTQYHCIACDFDLCSNCYEKEQAHDDTIKVWESGTLQLIEARSGDARVFDKSGQVVDRAGSTLRLKEGGGVFYAPSPISCVAVHEQMIVAGAASGELYHLVLL